MNIQNVQSIPITSSLTVDDLKKWVDQLPSTDVTLHPSVNYTDSGVSVVLTALWRD